MKKLFLCIVLMMPIVLFSASSSRNSVAKETSGTHRVRERIMTLDASLIAERGQPNYFEGLKKQKKFLDDTKSDSCLQAFYLKHSCLHGAVNILKCLLMIPAVDVNQPLQHDKGAGPLHLAAIHGRSEIVDMLLNHGALANMSDNEGFTPLHAAIIGGDVHIIERLLSLGAQVDAIAQRKINDPPIIKLEKKDDESLDIDSEEASQCSNLTTLHIALISGKTEIIQLLLERGANPNANSRYDRIPLITAIKTQNATAVELLIKAGADLNEISHCQEYPLAIAIALGESEIADKLINAGAKIDRLLPGNFSLLHVIAQYERLIPPCMLEIFKKDKGALEALFIADKNGDYPIHYTFTEKNTDLLQQFLMLDVNPNITNRYQETPLYLAAFTGNFNAVKILCEHKADLHAKNILGLSPLDAARMNGHKQIEHYLRNFSPVSQASSSSSSSSSSSTSQEIQDSVASSASSSSELEVSAAPVASVPKPVTHKGKGKSRNRHVGVAELFVVNDHTRQDDDQVFVLRQLAEDMTVVVHKQPKQVIPRVTNLRNMSGKEDKFHQFSSEVDRYLDRGIYIKASEFRTHAALLAEHDIREIRGFAILLPGKIEGTHYDARYAKLDIGQQTQGFDGAFIYLFDAQGRCYHRCFHQNKKYKNNISGFFDLQ